MLNTIRFSEGAYSDRVTPLFAITILLGSFLLFLVQPMFGRVVLPMLGGSPAVWNTCMMFFQLALLSGYLYAHLSIRFLGPRRSAMLHILLLTAAIVFIPLRVDPSSSPPAGNPVLWLLAAMSMTVGLPFVLLSANAPLLQRWYSTVNRPSAGDPYFLYSASNAGSMAALLAYPFAVEPWLDLDAQIHAWAMGFAIVTALAASASLTMWFAPARGEAQMARGGNMVSPPASQDPLTLDRRVRWILLAFVPSSLMLGVTAHITIDLVSAPLLWVLPLSLYLLSFILVFARRSVIPQRWVVRALPAAIIVEVVLLLIATTQPIVLIVAIHLMVFFIAAMACHGELAADRPAPARLTEFYLWLSVGGALGGVFNAIIAPVVFNSVTEYPIAIILLCLLAPGSRLYLRARSSTNTIEAGTCGRPEERGSVGWRMAGDFLLPLSICIVSLVLMVLTGLLPWLDRQTSLWLTAGLPALACFLLAARPVRFGLAIAAIFVAWRVASIAQGEMIMQERSFFGVHRVARLQDEGTEPAHALFHGTTLHGQQLMDPATNLPIEPRNPRSYYHADSPMARLFSVLEQTGRAPQHLGVVGLGAGSLAAFVDRGQSLTFFEIDPIVQSLAEDVQLFTFLRAARERGAEVDVVIGDARLTIGRRDGERFDLLVVDAFSSDAIPVHLLTIEAMRLYLDHLEPEGLLVFHISSRHFDLEPVLANVSAALGLTCMVKRYDTLNDEEERLGRFGSTWIAVMRSPDLAAILQPPQVGQRWEQARSSDDPVWTDNYSNVISAIEW